MNIVLGITGSVASRLSPVLHQELSVLGNVNVVATKSALNFTDIECYTDEDEWKYWHEKQEVLHIKLRQEASVLVLAPLDANTLAKMSNGICDNLLTSLVRAWDINRPIVIAPSMNTHMWEHPITNKQIDKILKWGYDVRVINPVEKTLVCGDTGIGALADIDNIVKEVQESLTWDLPLKRLNGIPCELPRP